MNEQNKTKQIRIELTFDEIVNLNNLLNINQDSSLFQETTKKKVEDAIVRHEKKREKRIASLEKRIAG